MKAILFGGRCDGEQVEVGVVAPPKIARLPYSDKEIELLVGAKSESPIPAIEYLRTARIRSDGCVVYVLKGAEL